MILLQNEDLCPRSVIPAQAGIHNPRILPHWIPACAGMTVWLFQSLRLPAQEPLIPNSIQVDPTRHARGDEEQYDSKNEDALRDRRRCGLNGNWN